VIPVFSRKPLFGYLGLVLATIAIGALSMGVWAHHMFTTGVVNNPFFSAMSLLIAVPTGVKFFAWTGTMWKGKISFTTPMLFALGFLLNFLIGGVTGVMLASAPIDFHMNDSYFVVAHFHYTIMGGSVFAIFAGIYFWFPKMTGAMLRERLGRLVAVLLFVGFNLTFWPQFVLGLRGFPRRYVSYPADIGFDTPNLVSTIGYAVMFAGVVVFLADVAVSLRRRVPAGDDPWGGNSLEWVTTSPPPEHNFDEIPIVRSLDELWHRKYAETESGVVVPVPAGGSGTGEGHGGGEGDGHGIHLPGPSYYPFVASIGLPLIGYGVIFQWWMAVVGVVVLLAGLYGWAMEPSAE